MNVDVARVIAENYPEYSWMVNNPTLGFAPLMKALATETQLRKEAEARLDKQKPS